MTQWVEVLSSGRRSNKTVELLVSYLDKEPVYKVQIKEYDIWKNQYIGSDKELAIEVYKAEVESRIETVLSILNG